MIRLFFVFALFFTLACSTTEKQVDQSHIPPPLHNPEEVFTVPTGYVNDFAYVFSPEEIEELEETIAAFEVETTNEIGLVTVDSIAPYESMQRYATDLANYWSIGKAEKNNGLLVVVNMNERNIFIATGLGTEKILTDDICHQVIEEIIFPELREGNFYVGITNGLEALMEKWTE